MDIDIDVGPFSHFHRIAHLPSVTASYSDRSNEIIDIGRSVGRTDLYGLTPGCRPFFGIAARIGLCAKIVRCVPSERNPYEDRTVAVAPAYIRRSLLMGDETEI